MASLLVRRLFLHTKNVSMIPRASTTGVNKLSTLAKTGEDKTPTELLSGFDEPEIRGEINKLLYAENELMTQLKTKDISIDWKKWKDEIKHPGLVDELEEQFKDIKTQNLDKDVDKIEKELNALFDPMISEYEQLAKDAEEETIQIEKQLKELNHIRDNIADLSLEEFFERYPKVKESIEQDIANNKWFIEQ